jgi:hypothetical protein
MFRPDAGFQCVILLHLEDWDPEGEFKRPTLQIIRACHPSAIQLASFLKLFLFYISTIELTRRDFIDTD